MYRIIKTTLALFCLLIPSVAPAQERPHVILVMADDQGWGDAGYLGHPELITPHLDAMAKNGLRFDRFYAGAPVCSPTRGSCLTGRHPFRYGIKGANAGHLPKSEPNLAAILGGAGYRCGHFGKWHLGTLTRTVKDANRGGRPRHVAHYAPPWERSFDVCFSTESKVPTFDPMSTPAKLHGGVGKREPGSRYGTAYWTGTDQSATPDIRGDDSHAIMDRALAFIDDTLQRKQPVFAVIWFHAPHLPVVGGPEDLKLYPGATGLRRHYLACLTALDRELGRLRSRLRERGIAKDTMLWYCSDNGPEGQAGRAPGSTGGLRGRKRSLYEGGIRVPGLLEWPARVRKPRVVTCPASTLDYLPTVLDALGIETGKPKSPLDGISLLPWVDGSVAARSRPIPFAHRQRAALIDNRFKLVRNGAGKVHELFDLVDDPFEKKDLTASRPELAARLRVQLDAWLASMPQ